MEPRLKILAVDDNRDNLLVLQAVIKDYLPEARVVTATSGAAGLALARSEDPDVALLDISMPGMDGFEVCRQLKSDEHLSTIPIVFLTAVRTDPGARIRALEMGAEGFLVQPVEEYALLAQVRAMAKLKAANVRQRREKEALAEQVAARTIEIEEQRDQLRRLVSAVPAAILMFDEQARVVLANPGAGQLFGAEASALVGKTSDDVLRCAPGGSAAPAAGKPCWCEGLRAAVVDAVCGRPVADRELAAELAPDAGERQLLCNAAPLTVGGRPGAVLVLRDITELRRVQREQEQVQAALAQSDRLMNMGLLAASVAHEINNPLTFILHNVGSMAGELPAVATCVRRCHDALVAAVGANAAAEVLGAAPQDASPTFFDDAVARLKEAHVGAQRIQRITRGLLTFSRVERMAPEPVDVHLSLEHALTLAMNEIRHRARVVKELGPVPQVLASEGKLAQVLLNLLVNAAHAIEGGELADNEIRVRTWEEPGTICIEIADTGKGIAPEHRQRLFKPFFTTKGVGLGSGLGLWISQNIVSELGGELSFESEIGKGTRFFVRLPAMKPAEQAPSDATQEEAAAGTKPTVRGRVLVIDDEPGVRALLARIIGAQHEVTTAASGAEARQLLAEPGRFDAVLCDLMMPEVSGMDVHAWLRERDAALAARLAFITGGVFTNVAARYLEQVPNPRVEKPFDQAALRELVGELVRQARRRQDG